MGDKKEIKEWLDKGKELNASYLIVLLDTYDNMIFNKYVLKDQTIEKAMLEVYKYHKRENIKVLKKYSFIKNEEKAQLKQPTMDIHLLSFFFFLKRRILDFPSPTLVARLQ